MSRRRNPSPPRPPTLTEILQEWAASSTVLQQQQGELVQRLSAGHLGGRPDRVQPPLYDGSTSWEVFERQFTGAATTNGWPAEERGRRLLQVLRGQAADIVLSLPPEAYEDYQSLQGRLSAHFGSARKGALAEAELERRVQNPGESLTDYAHAMRVLSRAAYSTWPEVAIEHTARKAFINGLADPVLQREVKRRQTATLNDALAAAVFVSSVDSAGPSAKRARVARATTDAVLDELPAGPSTSTLCLLARRV